MVVVVYYVILHQMFLYIYNSYNSYFTNYSGKYLVKLTLSRHIHVFLVKNIENILRLFIDFWRACLLCIKRNSWFVVHFTGYSTEEWLLWFTVGCSIKCFYTFITCIQYDRQKMLPFVSKDNRNNNCYWFFFSFSWDINVFNVVVGNYVFRKCLQKDANKRKQLKPFVYCIKIISAVAFFGGHTVAISYFTNYSGKCLVKLTLSRLIACGYSFCSKILLSQNWTGSDILESLDISVNITQQIYYDGYRRVNV